MRRQRRRDLASGRRTKAMRSGIRWPDAQNRQILGEWKVRVLARQVRDKQGFGKDRKLECRRDCGKGCLIARSRSLHRASRLALLGAARELLSGRLAAWATGLHSHRASQLGMDDCFCSWLQWAAADRQSNRRLEEEHHEGDHQASCRLHCFFRNTPSLSRTFRQDTYWFYSGTILTEIQSRRTCTWKRGRV